MIDSTACLDNRVGRTETLPMNISTLRLASAAFAALFLVIQTSVGQDSLRYYRLHLRGKNVPLRYLQPGDSLYRLATSQLTERAIERRRKVLPPERLVSTRDLPVDPLLLQRISATGARIQQVSRWFNTVMVEADSLTFERSLRALPFLDSVDVVRARPRETPLPKTRISASWRPGTPMDAPSGDPCIVDRYGRASFQNRLMGIDEAHRIGIAGEGVLVGILDAGFDWRSHRAFQDSRILGEYDFIYHDQNTANELQDSAAHGSQESHGTAVLSLMAATWLDTLVGGSPKAAYYLAKTEDLRFERHVEEDNFVAGLEWLESRGVDITNTSLGYTVFDAPEAPHTYPELNGRTVMASRAVNIATELGVVCVIAAGNEGAPGDYVYVSVPAEADSSIAAAAVDSLGRVATFSSRGQHGRSLKPDVSAFGVGNWAADASGYYALLRSRGTSFASPTTAAVAALVLSAAPELRPWELREILEETASQASRPDTAYGFGLINAGRALARLSVDRPVVGVPIVSLDGGTLNVAAYVMHRAQDDWENATRSGLDLFGVEIRNTRNDADVSSMRTQPRDGIARWALPAGPEGLDLRAGDSIDVSIRWPASSDLRPLRSTRMIAGEMPLWDRSTLCAEPALANSGSHGVLGFPNPSEGVMRISFWLDAPVRVLLTVHNEIGQEVARIYDDEILPAGAQAPMFDPRGLPSGAYYIRLHAGDETRTGSFIYLP